MHMKPQIPLLVAAVIMSACGTPETQEEAASGLDTTAEVSTPDWPGFYADTVPCADCPGIVERLHLRADSTYVMTDMYVERDSIPYGQIGSWTLSGDTLTLHTGDDARVWVHAGNRLDPVDQEGNRIDSPLSYSIERVDSFAYGPMHLDGGYVYYADAHSFTPDGSKYAFPVVADSTSMQLEKLYMKQVKDPPAPLQVRITAAFESGPSMEGNGIEEYLRLLRVEEGK